MGHITEFVVYEDDKRPEEIEIPPTSTPPDEDESKKAEGGDTPSPGTENNGVDESENSTSLPEEKKPSWRTRWKRNISPFFKWIKDQWNKTRAWYEENKKKQSRNPPRNKSGFKHWRLVIVGLVISLVGFLAYRYFKFLKAFLLKGFQLIETHEFLFYCIVGAFSIFILSLFRVKKTKGVLWSAVVVTSLATMIYFFGPWMYKSLVSSEQKLEANTEVDASEEVEESTSPDPQQGVLYNQDSLLGVIAGLKDELNQQKDSERVSLQRKDQEIASLKEKLGNKVSEPKTKLVEKIVHVADTASKAENATLKKLLVSKDTQIASHEKTIRDLYKILKEKREEKDGYVLPKGVRSYREIN